MSDSNSGATTPAAAAEIPTVAWAVMKDGVMLYLPFRTREQAEKAAECVTSTRPITVEPLVLRSALDTLVRELDESKTAYERMAKAYEILSAAWDKAEAEHARTVSDLRDARARVEELEHALEPFAAMHREGCDPKELACQRGVASDMTILISGDFQRGADLLAALSSPAPRLTTPENAMPCATCGPTPHRLFGDTWRCSECGCVTTVIESNPAAPTPEEIATRIWNSEAPT